MGLNIKQRLRAGGVHLLGCLVVASGVAAWVFGALYPSPLAQMQGVSHVLLLMITVDAILGPLLTTVVYNPAKQRLLKLDLTIIVLVQVIAMACGLYTIFIARPALIVYNVGQFNIVAASDMDPNGLALARRDGKPGLPWFGPQVVGAELPSSPKEKADLMFSSLDGGYDLPQLAQWHVPYAAVKEQVQAKLRPISQIKSEYHLNDLEWHRLLTRLGESTSDYGYLPLIGREQEGVAIVNRKSAKVERLIALDRCN